MKLRSMVFGAVFAAVGVAPAMAELQTLNAYEDAEADSGFNLSFPDLDRKSVV